LPVYDIIGANIPRVDAFPKSKGEAVYIEDMKPPGTLSGGMVRSPHNHAKILSIDTSKARALPGVKAVITANDIPKVLFGMLPTFNDQYALAVDRVRHYLEAVAAVAAIDDETAQEAVGLIKVEYEPLPAVLDPAEAIKQGAPQLHQAYKNNISLRVTRTVGDIEKAFSECDYVREDVFRTQPQNTAAMEVHGCVSLWELDGTLTHWSTNQAPFLLQRAMAKVLGIEADRVRVILPMIGGGFGSKTVMFAHDIASAYLSRMTGKPVKTMLTREEVFHATNQRHPFQVTLKTGVMKDGTLVALSSKILADGGAYAGTGGMALNVAEHTMLLPYRMKSYHYDAVRALTNKPIGGPYQGHGGPQVRFATETQLDMVAKEIGMDPMEIRLKNFVYVGYDHVEHYKIHSCGLKQCLEFVEKELDWKKRKGKLPPGRGIGVAFSGGPSSVVIMPHTPTGISIQINWDGGVSVFSGGADIGQGMDTVVCQAVAQELGLSMDNIRLTRADTQTTPFDKGTYGTGGAMRVGKASVMAAKQVKKKLLEVLAQKFETPPENIEFGRGKIYVKGHFDKGVEFADAIKIYRYSGKPMPLMAMDAYEPDVNDFNTVRNQGGNFSPTYSFLGAGFEVEVDKETGTVKIIKAVITDDLGRVINKMGQEGQLEGAISKGIGMGLYEDLPNIEGKYINPHFLEYYLMTALDEPKINEIAWTDIETIDPVGPFGAKSSGEQALSPVPPALANAIYDAVGVWMKELPMTPERIKKAIEAQKSK